MTSGRTLAQQGRTPMPPDDCREFPSKSDGSEAFSSFDRTASRLSTSECTASKPLEVAGRVTRSPSPRTSPYPLPSPSSPRKRSRSVDRNLKESLKDRKVTGGTATAARKTRKTAAAAITPASVSTGSNESSTQATRPVRSLPRRANKISGADKSAIDESARRPTERKANVEKLASPPADSTARTSASRKRSAVALPDDTPSTTTTPKSTKKTRKTREIDFDDDEPAVLPAGPSQSAKLVDSSKLSADARRKVKGKAKITVDEKDAELVRLKQELKAKEELAEKQSQALAALRSSVACGLCNELLENPHSLKCGHIFCLEIAWTTEPDSNDDAHNSERSDSATDSEDDASGDESDASAAAPSPSPSASSSGARIEEIDDDEAAEIEQSKAGPSRVRSGRREPVPARDGLALALTRRRQGGAVRRSPSPAPSADDVRKEICCPTCGESCADTRPTRVVLFNGILDTMRKAGVTASGVVGGDKGKKKEKVSVAEEEDETWGGLFPVEEKKEDSPDQVVEVAEAVEEKEVVVEAVTKDDGHDTENLSTDESGSKDVSGEVEKPGKSGEGNASTVANVVEPATAIATVKDRDETSAALVASSSATPLTAKATPTGLSTPSFFGITAFRSSSSSSASLSSDSSFATSAAAFGLPARSRSRSTSSSSASSSSSQDSTPASSVLEDPKQDPSSPAPARHIRGESERKNKDSGLRLETEVLTRSASPRLRIARPQQGRKSGLGSDSTDLASGSSKNDDAEVETSQATTTVRKSRKRAREEEDGETATAKEAVAKGKKTRRA
ncbi:Proteophosphoglycan ppg4 [Rhodotorula toruloides]|nr:Proteophosphoglycan ppg4 [Rhodotorula toruloides]